FPDRRAMIPCQTPSPQATLLYLTRHCAPDAPFLSTLPLHAALPNTRRGLCSAVVALGTTATDNCPGVTLTGTRSDGLPLTDAYPKGVTTISWLATDAHSNTSTATQAVTGVDNESPTIASTSLSVFTDPGLCSAASAHGTTAAET